MAVTPAEQQANSFALFSAALSARWISSIGLALLVSDPNVKTIVTFVDTVSPEQSAWR
jgi:hypothetical protein